jgi:hypothetical protein
MSEYVPLRDPCELVFDSRLLGAGPGPLVPKWVVVNGNRVDLPRGSRIDVKADAGQAPVVVTLSLFPTRLEFRPHPDQEPRPPADRYEGRDMTAPGREVTPP